LPRVLGESPDVNDNYFGVACMSIASAKAEDLLKSAPSAVAEVRGQKDDPNAVPT
jgi:hypothetical protein